MFIVTNAKKTDHKSKHGNPDSNVSRTLVNTKHR